MSKWSTYAVCPCGWFAQAHFGSKFHIHKEVCPDCGKDKEEWNVVVGRIVYTKTKHWWQVSEESIEEKADE